MKKINISILILIVFQLGCNKKMENKDNININIDTLNNNGFSDSLNDNNPENYYKNTKTYGFAVFKVYNDLNQRLNDIGNKYNRRPRPVEYNVVSEIITFDGIITEESKYRTLDKEQANLNGNLSVLDRSFLTFNSYEEASIARSKY